MRLSLSSSTSSAWHSHPLCWSSRSKLFFKIDVPKNFTNVTGKHRCFPVKFAKLLRAPFFTEHLRWLHLSVLLFMNVFFFSSLAAALSLLPYSTVTFSFEETLWSLYHYYIITIIIREWFIRIAATATTYCTATSMIVICISALTEFMLKWKKRTYE